MTNPDIHQEILLLTKEWYSLISGGHHKDRDCHWNIETRWSYGNPPNYYVYHYGYLVANEIAIKASSYEDALNKLKKALENTIANEKDNSLC
jgi:hypothetical protein